MPSRYPTILLPLLKGLNLRDDPYHLKPGELIAATNVIINPDGSIERINGYSDFLTSDLGSGMCLSLYIFKRWSGTVEYLFIYDDTLYVYTDVSGLRGLKSGLTNDQKVGYVTFNDYCYFGNGFDTSQMIRPNFVHYKDSGDVCSTADATDLSSAITLANSLKISLNSHFNDTSSHNDNFYVFFPEDAKDYYSLAILLDALKNDYMAHRTYNGVHYDNDNYHAISSASISLTDDLPTMTSDTAPSPYVVSASSEYPSKKAYQAVDSSTLTYWRTWSGVTTGWWKIDLGSGGAIVAWGYTITSPSDETLAPASWTLEGSNDDITYTTLDTQSSVTDWTGGETKAYHFTNTTAYRYYKLNITANNGNSSFLGISDIQIFASGSYSDVVNNSITLANEIKLCYNQHVLDCRVVQWGLPAPSSAPSGSAVPGSGLEVGTYQYYFTYYNPVDGVESAPSPILSVTTTSGNQQVDLTGIVSSTEPMAMQKRIYRTTVGGSVFYRVDTISNEVTTYSDTTGDASLGAACATENISTIPACRFFVTFKNRIYMAGNPAEPYRMYFTEVDFPSYYKAYQNYFDYDVGITGLAKLPNGILVFEEHRTWFEVGTSPFNFQRRALSKEVGCVDADSITYIDGNVVFMSHYGLMITDGSSIKPLSDKINDELLTKNIESACATYDSKNRRLYIAVAEN
ncbi:MAG: discoidin domain-containing protein [Nitrospirae bacterium]|nr:MAG: discoidin domain-containing protein [Nitrospirota bacterium]